MLHVYRIISDTLATLELSFVSSTRMRYALYDFVFFVNTDVVAYDSLNRLRSSTDANTSPSLSLVMPRISNFFGQFFL